MAKKKQDTNMLVAALVVVAIIVVGAFLLTRPGSKATATTTITTIPTKNLTSTTVASLTTTIVKNLTTAIGPNLAGCNGFNYSTSTPSQSTVGSCGWRGGLMNVSIFGGPFTSTSLTLVQQNVTTAPFNATFAGTSCALRSNVFYVAGGNYKVTFATGFATLGVSCGPAYVRLSK